MRRMTALLIAVLVCLCGCGKMSTVTDDTLEIHVLALGNASCVLVKQGEHALLVDAGDAAQADRTVAYLHTQGVDTVEAVLQTYPSLCCIGGMERILQTYDVNAYLHAPLPERFAASTPLSERLWSMVTAAKIPTHDVRGGMTCMLGTATVEIYPQMTSLQTAEDHAAVCRVSFGNKRFLLLSQTGGKGIEALVDSGADIAADVMILPPHNGTLSTTARLLKAVSPEAVVFTGAGEIADAGEETAMLWQGITVWHTDQHGDVVLITDGHEQERVITTR